MPSFADLQFKTTLYPGKHTRLTLFALAGREMLQEMDLEPDGDVTPTASNKGENRIAAATLRWTPSSRTSNTTTLSAYSTSSRYQDLRAVAVYRFRAFRSPPCHHRLRAAAPAAVLVGPRAAH